MKAADLIGSSPKFQVVLDKVAMVAPVHCSVLIQGETGTGKELVARAIHDASTRRDQTLRGRQLRRDSECLT